MLSINDRKQNYINKDNLWTYNNSETKKMHFVINGLEYQDPNKTNIIIDNDTRQQKKQRGLRNENLNHHLKYYNDKELKIFYNDKIDIKDKTSLIFRLNN
jgi:hypothetical protein